MKPSFFCRGKLVLPLFFFVLLFLPVKGEASVLVECLPTADVHIRTFGGGVGSSAFLKFDISNLPPNCLIDSAFLFVYVFDTVGNWDGDVYFWNVNSQTWSESDSAHHIWAIPTSNWIDQGSDFGTVEDAWAKSVDVKDIVLVDYLARNSFTSFKLQDPDDPTSLVPPSLPENHHASIRLGESLLFGYIRFRPREHQRSPVLRIYYSLYDVGVKSIVSPRGVLDSGSVVIPSVWIKNYGTDSASFSAFFRIKSVSFDTVVYSDTEYLTLAPNDSILQTFADFSLPFRGWFRGVCSTRYDLDLNPANNKKGRKFGVYRRWREDFNIPWSTVSPPPGWRITWTGDTSTSDWHRRDSSSSPWTQNLTPYASILYLTSDDTPDSLFSWTLDLSEMNNVYLRCSTYFRPDDTSRFRAKIVGFAGLDTYLIKDYRAAFGPGVETFRLDWADLKNDVRLAWILEGEVRGIYWWGLDNVVVYGDEVFNNDCGIYQILSPLAHELPDSVYPQVLVKNFGLATQTVNVFSSIHEGDTLGSQVYLESTQVTISPLETVLVNLPAFHTTGGSYGIRFWTVLLDTIDENPENDSVARNFVVDWTKTYLYDDSIGVGDTFFYFRNEGIGVRFIPEHYPFKISSAHFYFRAPDTLPNRFKIRLLADDGPDSSPGTILFESKDFGALPGWNEIDLSEKEIFIKEGGFYLFYLTARDNSGPFLGRDQARNPIARDYYYLLSSDSIYGKDSISGDWMIRVTVDFRPPELSDYDARVSFIFRPRGELYLRPLTREFPISARIENFGTQTLYPVSTEEPVVVCTVYNNLGVMVYSDRKTLLSESLPMLAGEMLSFNSFVPPSPGWYRIAVRTSLSDDTVLRNDSLSQMVFIYPAYFTGGPDHGIYRHYWIDSDTTGGPLFSWVDTSDIFTLISEGDGASVEIPGGLPFPFRFYDTSYTYLRVSCDGWLSFRPVPVLSGENKSIPNANQPNGAIYPFWDDLILGRDFGGGRIGYKVIGEAPQRKLVIIWDNVKRKETNYWSSEAGLTFEVILDENGTITCQYLDVECGDRRYDNGRSATVGIEDTTGGIALEYLFGEGQHNLPGNLLASGRAIRFYRLFQDAGIAKIVSPKKEDYPGLLAPRVKIGNFGTLPDTFRVFAKIFYLPDTVPVYSESLSTSLAPSETTTLSFPGFSFNPGFYLMRCSTYSTEDDNFRNDTASLYFTLRKWRQERDIPRGISGRKVRSGALAYADGKVYALKGHNTNEFWGYEIEKDSWISLPPLPDSSGLLKRRTRTKYGCALTYNPDQRKIYAFKGGRSQDMYAFDLNDSTWSECCTIPKGMTGKGPGRGGSLVYDQISRLLFAIKGDNSLEFWSYDPIADRWELKLDFPTGPYLKRLGNGSALAAKDGIVYGVKGRNTQEFYGYDVNNNTWRTLKPVGYPSFKKVRSGACLTPFADKVYLALGGNSLEFLSYEILLDTWLIRDSVPKGPYNRKVKIGAALTASDSILYLFKGGNRTEFWSYGAYLDLAKELLTKGIMEEEVVKIRKSSFLELSPNPSGRFLKIKATGFRDGKEKVKVFTIDGRLLVTLSIPKEGLIWNWQTKEGKSLPSGVYLFQLEGGKPNLVRKIIKM